MAAIVMMVFALGVLLCLASCAGKTYQVDYGGQKDFYQGAKDSYRGGQNVTLYYTFIATDTDYSFYLDGEYLSVGYDDSKGFIIQFTMPDHAVTLECRAKESMTYVPEPEEETEDTMLLSCYREHVDGVEYHELVISTTNNPEEVRLDVYIKAEGMEETRETFYIAFFLAEDFLQLIEESGFSEWNDLEDAVSMDGSRKGCRFWGSDGLIEVSTEHMPEDGEEKLDTLFELVARYTNGG